MASNPEPCFYIEEVDDHELLVALTKVTCKELPEGKQRKKTNR